MDLKKSLAVAVSTALLASSPALAASTAPAAGTPVVGAKLGTSVTRASHQGKDGNKLQSGAILPMIIAAAVVAGGIYVAVDDDDDDNAVSPG